MARKKKNKGHSQSTPSSKTIPDVSPDQRGADRYGLWLGLVGTVLFANACIMTVELLAGRLVARYLGQSLYTWTTIIGVILAGMALGNYLGGRLVDRHQPRRLLAVLLFGASAACLGILVLNTFMGGVSFVQGLSWPLRTVVHVGVAFLVPGILLGTINPVVARIALTLGTGPGQTVGIIYGAAAAGSIGGTFMTGFVLMDHFGYTAIIYLVSAALAGLAVVYAVNAGMKKEQAAALNGANIDPENLIVESANEHVAGPFTWYGVIALAFLANAAFMVMELSASRMATEYLGQSLYTWTTLLGIILAGITLGNNIGGRLADHHEPWPLLSFLLLMSALACLCVPSLNTWLGTGGILGKVPTVHRIIYHIGLAFSLPAIVLGAIGPVIARIALGLGRPVGTTLGNVYAWGALGSVSGTFLTGFMLIDHLNPVGALCLLATVLAFSSMFCVVDRRPSVAVVLFSAVALFISQSPWQTTRRLAAALGMVEQHVEGIIYTDHSQYSWIKVAAPPTYPSLRYLQLDALLHTTVDISAPTKLFYGYLRIYNQVLAVSRPDQQPISTFMIGGGGYAFPRYIELTRPGSHIEVAEIDPAVTYAAREVLGFPDDSTVVVHNSDARNHVEDLLRRKKRFPDSTRFDVVIGDAFNQFSVPFQLTTVEFNQALFDLLDTDGLYLFNLIDEYKSARFLGSVITSLQAVFPHVYVFSNGGKRRPRDTFVVVASKKALNLTQVPERLRRRHLYTGNLLSALEVAGLAKGKLPLTDDYAPVENLLASLTNTQGFNVIPDKRATYLARLLAKGEIRKAVPILRAVLNDKPDNHEARQRLGVALARMKDLSGAISEFQRILEDQPDNDEIHFNLATVLAQTGRLEEAVPHYRKALAGDPTNADAHLVLGQFLVRQAKPDQALTHLREALRYDKENPAVHKVLGQFHFGRGDTAKAVLALEHAVELNSEDPDLHLQLGIIYSKQGNPAKAGQHLRETLRLRPADAMAHFLLANMEARSGNFGKARKHYLTTIESRPGMVSAHVNLGNTYLREGRLAEARKHYTKAVSLGPEYAPAHFNLGRVLLNLGKVRRAIVHFKTVLDINPEFVRAREELARARALLERDGKSPE